MYRVCVETVTTEIGCEYKLYEDRNGVRHWRYPFTGILILCGQDQFFHEAGHDVVDSYPTCLTCIMVLARDEQR